VSAGVRRFRTAYIVHPTAQEANVIGRCAFPFVLIATVVAALVLALPVIAPAATREASGAMAQSTRCTPIIASGRQWIIVATRVPCSTAQSVARSFAARTVVLKEGQSKVLKSPLRGYNCIIAHHGLPGGTCTAGTRKSIFWYRA
jgi:energy-converting hydrogenase Eha subunit A